MKLCNILVGNETHLAVMAEDGVRDLSAAGFAPDMDGVIAQGLTEELKALAASDAPPPVKEPVFANVVGRTGKLLCVGLNYKAHAENTHMKLPEYPILFSKFANALAPSGAEVCLPDWENSYDYEAELVIVMGREAWNVDEREALQYVFGYSCGNDLSCRDAQMRSGQWLIGKSMPGFGPCGPCIVTADSFDPDGKRVRSYVNSQLRQDGNTSDMIFSCAQIVSYASRYVRLCPGDLIYTGTPSGVALEKSGGAEKWLHAGDRVDIVIEGIGTLTNIMA